MSRISVSVTDELQQKIADIAARSGRSLDDCIALALRDYVENYEDVYKTDRCTVNNFERSFFLSIGE